MNTISTKLNQNAHKIIEKMTKHMKYIEELTFFQKTNDEKVETNEMNLKIAYDVNSTPLLISSFFYTIWFYWLKRPHLQRNHAIDSRRRSSVATTHGK